MLIRTVVCGVCKELNAARMNSCKHCRVTKMYPSLAIAPLLFFTHLRAALSSGTSCSGNFCGANEYCDYNNNNCAAKNDKMPFVRIPVNVLPAIVNQFQLLLAVALVTAGNAIPKPLAMPKLGVNTTQRLAIVHKPVREIARPR